MSKSSFSIRNSHPRELEFLDEYNMRKINLTPPSSGYSQSASLLAHNRMLLCSLSGVACTTPNTSKSPAYCFAQLKQGTCLIRLTYAKVFSSRMMVKGPSLQSSTFISAPNTPCSTTGTLSLQCFSIYSYSFSASAGGPASVKLGRFP